MRRIQNDHARYTAGFLLLAVLLALLVIWNINTGSVDIPAGEILRILLHGPDGSTAANIVWQLRLPRILTAVILGGALAVSGFLLQTFFRNPIAGPFVLGISSGAKLMLAFVMIGLLSRGRSVSAAGMVTAAFAGSMISMGLVLAVSAKVNSMPLLVVCGVMISYICSAVTDFAVTFADDSNIVNLHNWSMGSFSSASWENIRSMTVLVALTCTLAFLLSKPMGAYLMGESYAESLGVNLRLLRAMLILASSLLAACVTAFAGPVSFVGIAVPHLMKQILRTSRPVILIPGCFLGGAVFCLFCDLIARTAFAPSELSISSVTAVFGAPVVLILMIRRQTQK